MRNAPDADITRLLIEWGKGDERALQELAPRVQHELHRLASHYMAGERQGHVLQPTALVNEAYLKLVNWKDVQWADRAHFFGIAAGMMRRVLIDYARAKSRGKRGGAIPEVTLSQVEGVPLPESVDPIALDDALRDLERVAPRQTRVIELRYFAGLSLEETAEAMRVSVGTVRRDWNLARAWLFRELSRRSSNATAGAHGKTPPRRTAS
jgi:RNA polymerase sigma factor (TIGR02999 family)